MEKCSVDLLYNVNNYNDMNICDDKRYNECRINQRYEIYKMNQNDLQICHGKKKMKCHQMTNCFMTMICK